MENTVTQRRINKNSIANLLNRVWTTVANFLFVPIYIHYLGEEAYGLITFFTTLQVVMNLLGLGLSKTLRREFSLEETSIEVVNRKYKILRSIEIIIWIVAVLIVLICSFNAHFIATKWITALNISDRIIMSTIRLMGISIAGQLVANLYIGCLFGQQDQVSANSIQITWSLVKNIGAVLLIVFVSANVLYFYVWHAIIDILYAVIVRYIIIFKLRLKGAVFSWRIRDLSNLKTVYKFAIGVLLISIGYAINSQIDKIIISKNFDLTKVGAYNSVYNLSILTTIITSSIGVAVFPRFTQLFSTNSISTLNSTFKENYTLSVLSTAAIGSYLSIFATEVISFWTQSQIIVDTVSGFAFWLIIGTTLSALQEIPYNYFLARGCTIVNNIQTIIQIVYTLTITPFMIYKFGLKGASLAWLIEMALSTTIYLFVFCKMYLAESPILFILRTFAPVFIFTLIAGLVRYLLMSLSLNSTARLVLAIIFGGITLGASVIFFKKKILSLWTTY